MTVYCYDTEFIEDGSTIELISIAIVCEDGREYYAINSDADWDRIRKDDWLMDNVVRHLPTHSTGQVEKRTGFGDHGWSWGGIHMKDTRVKPKWCIANEVREFIIKGIAPSGGTAAAPKWTSEDLPELWSYYGAYDHVVLAQLYGRMIHLPQMIPMFTHELMQLVEPLQRRPGGFQFPPTPEDAHDALADARWHMELLNAARAAAVR